LLITNRMVKISLLSLNLASMTKIPREIDFVSKSYDPDIHVEMTQEDARISTYGTAYDNESILDKSKFPAVDYSIVGKESLNQMTTKQNAVLRIWSKRGAPVELLARGRIQLSSKGKNSLKNKFLTGVQKGLGATGILGVGITKGAVYLKIKYQDSVFLFINMHLQMNKHQEGLGLAIRKKGFLDILKQIEKLKLIDDTTSVFVGGDLNFRMDMQGKNQLNSLMPEIPFLKELPIDPAEKKFTCKFKEGTDTPCRTEPSPDTSDAGMYKAGIQRRWDGCMEPLRIPSRCDRFLYRLPSTKILTIPYYKVLNLLAESDHNAIWSVVDVTDGQGETFPSWNKYPDWNKKELSTGTPCGIAQKYTAVVEKLKDGMIRVIFRNATLKADKLPRSRTRKN